MMERKQRFIVKDVYTLHYCDSRLSEPYEAIKMTEWLQWNEKMNYFMEREEVYLETF